MTFHFARREYVDPILSRREGVFTRSLTFHPGVLRHKSTAASSRVRLSRTRYDVVDSVVVLEVEIKVRAYQV
jgi:hypothetical protein